MANTNFDFVNYTGAFKFDPAPNRLLVNLGVFQTEISDQAKVSLDRLITANQASIDPVERYGSDWAMIMRSRADLTQYEIPHYAIKARVNVSDWQGKRVVGEDRPMTADDIIADYVVKQQLSMEDVIEKAYADSLFRNVQASQFTEQPDLNIATELGLAQQVQNIDFGNATIMVDVALDDIHTKIRTALGDRASYLKQVVCVCSPAYFKALKSNKVVREQFAFVQPFDPNNIVTNYKEVLPAVQYFHYNDIMFVMSNNNLHGITNNEAYYFPLMMNGSGVYKHFAGPASRHAEIAATGGARYHQYVTTEPQYKNREVHTECGLLAMNFLPNAVIRSANAA